MTFFYWLYSRLFVICMRIKGAKIGKNFQTHGPVDILIRDNACIKNLIIGDNVVFGGKTYIRMRKQGKIILKDGVRTGTEVWLVSANEAELSIGNNTILGSYNILNGGHGLDIGAHAIFAAFVYVNTSDHGFRRHDLIQNQGFFGAPVVIGNDVWVGGHVFINKGVTIGNGTIIGAGAIVTKDIPEYSIAVGNPAKVIKKRV